MYTPRQLTLEICFKVYRRDTCVKDITVVSLSSAAASAKLSYMSLAKKPMLDTVYVLMLLMACHHGIERKILLELLKVEVEQTFTMSYNLASV